MMKKNLKHFVAIVLLVSFAVLALGSATTPRESTPTQAPLQPDTFVFRITEDFQRVQIVPPRDWVSVGLIFITSTARLDSRGNIIDGSMITNEMLMLEAQRLGANDVINIRKDEIHHITSSGVEVTYKVNALAIRYTTLPEGWSVIYQRPDLFEQLNRQESLPSRQQLPFSFNLRQ